MTRPAARPATKPGGRLAALLLLALAALPAPAQFPGARGVSTQYGDTLGRVSSAYLNRPSITLWRDTKGPFPPLSYADRIAGKSQPTAVCQLPVQTFLRRLGRVDFVAGPPPYTLYHVRVLTGPFADKTGWVDTFNSLMPVYGEDAYVLPYHPYGGVHAANIQAYETALEKKNAVTIRALWRDHRIYRIPVGQRCHVEDTYPGSVYLRCSYRAKGEVVHLWIGGYSLSVVPPRLPRNSPLR